MAFATDAARWAAVQTRDPSADGAFVYCVRTTKIYCRPICKARLARRANVSFQRVARDAERAGFRACRRCHPEQAGAMPDEQAVQKIQAFIARASAPRDSAPLTGDLVSDGTPVTEPPQPSRIIHGGSGQARKGGSSLKDMAAETGLSRWHFHRVFKKVVGMTPKEWVTQQARLASDHTPSINDFDDFFMDFDSWDALTSEIDFTLDGSFGVPLGVACDDAAAPLYTTTTPHAEAGKPIVSYSTRPVLGGWLLAAAIGGRIGAVSHARTQPELTAVLQDRFPDFLFTHVAVEDGAADSRRKSEQKGEAEMAIRLNSRMDALVELLEQPI